MDLLNKNRNIDDKFLPTLKLVNKTLSIKDFPKEKLTRHASGTFYELLLKHFNESKVSNVSMELGNVNAKDIHALALIDSCGTYCARHSISLSVSGVSRELKEMLKKIGFTTDSSGTVQKLPVSRTDFFLTFIGESVLYSGERLKFFFGFIGGLTTSVIYSIIHPGKIQWRETFYYMDKSGAEAVPIVSLICFLMGAILAFQGVVQMGHFGLSIYVANLVGLSIVKELGALMVAVICIGRAGSAYAAEIGTMKVSEELDAMETMGLDLGRFLVIPKVIALVCVMPLLTIIGDIFGIIGGMLVGVMKSNVTFSEYYLRTIQAISYSDMLEGIIKSIIFAVLIAIIGCLRGSEAENDAKGVGRATTSSVVTGVFFIVIADAIITALIN